MMARLNGVLRSPRSRVDVVGRAGLTFRVQLSARMNPIIGPSGVTAVKPIHFSPLAASRQQFHGC